MRSVAQTSLVALVLLAALQAAFAARPGPLTESGATIDSGVAEIIAGGDAEHARALLASASSIMFDSAFGDAEEGIWTTSWGSLERSSLGHVANPTSFQQKRTLLSTREISEEDWP
ncbi:hypothetical protein WJX81_006671 [Elliptochloris bilobata]|uniref:Uncharacterized protein n=1 Tax=Elliptochloris bilobata TaxID=381761 RepID=A0AAW1S841_9CHLO